LGDELAGLDTAGQGDALDPGIVDDWFTWSYEICNCVSACRSTGVDPEFLKGDGALRNTSGVLDHDHIAGH